MLINSDFLQNSFNNFMEKNLFRKKIKRISIGVSGGADSLALALLSKCWAQKFNRDIIVYTVDHGLRQESKEEAKIVNTVMRQNNIFHKTLVWEGYKPTSDIQNQARIARYKLFAEANIKYNVQYIILGHHKNDQIETFMMRLIKSFLLIWEFHLK